MCILCAYVLLKVVSHHNFSVLSMSLMGFQKSLDRGVGGCGKRLSSIILDFFEFVFLC